MSLDAWQPPKPDRLLTAKEVGEMLSVSAQWVLDHVHGKKPCVPAVRLGGTDRHLVRFRREDIEKFIAEQTR